MDKVRIYQIGKKLNQISLSYGFCLIFVILSTGCSSSPPLLTSDEYFITLDGDQNKKKSIFVFLDGTANDKTSETNVWRLFQQIKQNKNSQTIGRYIEGVGSVSDPPEEDPLIPIFGDALGMGMKARILEGYKFLTKNYNPGDEIFIFGFSRGAHQARALAGLISYTGIPKVSGPEETLDSALDDIFKMIKETRDEDYRDQWQNWMPNQPPLLDGPVKKNINNVSDVLSAEVKFLGVWDTVPGSSFKNYEECKEKIGFWKTYAFWLPIISRGERYKSDSYPTIRNIAHAIAQDEKRSKFAPLFLCEAISKKNTHLDEIWFPGAHADVGGGYEDRNNDLPNISLNWMINLLSNHYQFSAMPNKFTENVSGLEHWSFGDSPGNMGSECEDRQERNAPLGYHPHPSIEVRRNVGVIPIKIKGSVNEQDWKYPIKCPGPGK